MQDEQKDTKQKALVMRIIEEKVLIYLITARSILCALETSWVAIILWIGFEQISRLKKLHSLLAISQIGNVTPIR